MYIQPKLTPTNMNNRNHGGARKGAGGKPAGYVPPQEKVDFDAARARNEMAKAELNELELAIKRGEYVERVVVREMASTAMATMAQTLRSVPDNLERKLGVSPEVALEVGLLLDNALNDIADAFDEMVKHADDAQEESGYEDLL